jgi:aspartyl-tRNA synthetase
VRVAAPFKRIAYNDALMKYGTDIPICETPYNLRPDRFFAQVEFAALQNQPFAVSWRTARAVRGAFSTVP